MSRPPVIRKSDLAPAFAAAKAAGWENVSVSVETADGHRYLITASRNQELAQANLTPLEKWKAGRAS